jgi:outer membrane lipoprotein-sorting protein
MTLSRSRRCAALVLVSILPLTGCLFRSHRVEQPIAVPLKSATCEELIAYVNNQAGRVQTMQATVDIDTSVGGEKKGKVTNYQSIRGYVLARKPAMLRMIGLLPIVRDRAFDMVSDGREFKLWIPPKNRFIIGRNDREIQNPTEPLENLRPQHIYDALLLRPIDRQAEIAVCEEETSSTTNPKGQKVVRGEYILDVIRTGEQPFLSRKIVFDRTDLLPHRQLLYDLEGKVQTVAVYENYREDSGINFPWRIEIARPQEEYAITLSLVKLDLNLPLPDDKFILEQPPGVEVVHLDKQSAIPVSGAQPTPNARE